MPLARVKEEIAASLTAEWTRQNFGKFFQALAERLRQENPVIIQGLDGFAQNLKQGGLDVDPIIVIYAGLMVYSLLERQQIADEMDEQFGS